MTAETYLLTARWEPRPESTRACAFRLAHMLEGLAKIHRAFARWNKQARTRAAADKPFCTMPPEIDELTGIFEKGRFYTDVGHKLIADLGYSVGAWNGHDGALAVSFRVEAGDYTRHRIFPNAVDLNMRHSSAENTDLLRVDTLKPALLTVVAAWEPVCANIVPPRYWPRLFESRRTYPPFRSGWMTYLAARYASRIAPPAGAIAAPVAGGGLLLLATEEPFTLANPAHLAAADAIQAALEPIQGMVRPAPRP